MFLSAVKIALRALWRNAVRSFLTILGMIIGVAAIIAMVNIGRGASAAVQEQISKMGIICLSSSPAARRRPGSGPGLVGCRR